MAKPNPTSYPNTDQTEAPTQAVDYRRLEFIAHKDPQIELVLGLEALLDQAESSGAHPEDISFALNYVTNRARPHRSGPQEGEDVKWPDEDEVPAGPYYDYKNDPQRAARAAEGRLDQEGTV